MNILLVQPVFKKNEKSYPLGLSCIAAVLAKAGHKVYGRDLSFDSFSEIETLIKEKTINIIGISIMSYNIRNAIDFCQKIKCNNCNIPLVAGGPHVTVFKEQLFFKHKNCFDYLITGEGEDAFCYLADCLENKRSLNSINNLIYMNQGKLVRNIKSDDCNFDQLPFGDRKLFPIFKYKGMISCDKNYTQIITSRGCDQNCFHCPEPNLWSGWKGRSVENIIAEIRSIAAEFGIKDFHIEDANFFGGGIERIKNFCHQLIKNKLNIKWQCPNGIPYMEFKDLSVLRLMAQAGCYSICIGVESFDKNFSNKIKRFPDFGKLKKIVKKAHEEGIEIIGYFILGFPGQSKSSIEEDLNLSRKVGFDFVQYSIFHLIPGSWAYQKYEFFRNKSRKRESNIGISGIKIKRLKQMRRKALLLNFFRARSVLFLLKTLKKTKNPLKIINKIKDQFIK